MATKLWSKPGNVLDNVNEYIRERFIYMPERIETIQTPDYMVNGLEINNRLTGDCDDIATFHATLLTILDIKVKFTAIRSELNDPDFDHVYIEAFDKESKQWILFDSTVPPGTNIEYFSKMSVAI